LLNNVISRYIVDVKTEKPLFFFSSPIFGF